VKPDLKKYLQGRLSPEGGRSKCIQLWPVGGGSINDTYHVVSGEKTFFCKINSATKFPHLFAKEKKGLEFLAQQSIINIPAVVDQFEEEGFQFLLLQWVQEGNRTENFWKKFGEQLALLHQVSHMHFGWHEYNYMGSVLQQNTPCKNWCSFFATERLQPMVKRCTDKGFLNKTHLDQFEVVSKKLPAIFDEEPPSLLHGDLWSGNFMCNSVSEPVLIDPAVYFGHRSVDLGMTALFGGFRRPFYEAYHYHCPLPANYEEQWAICNLYPLLIHLFLFGSGYLSQIERTLKAFA
jgi:protein-ribulosamine 3-kinase